MITGEQAKEIVFNALHDGILPAELGGNKLSDHLPEVALSYSDERIAGLRVAVTVGLINITDVSGPNNSQLADLNVNIYAKDISQESENQISPVPDRGTLDNVTVLVKALLGDDTGIYWGNGRFHITGMSAALKLPQVKEHFINIRVRMKFYINKN